MRILAVNLKGPFLCARAVLPHMIERKAGRIVAISSIHLLQIFLNAHQYSDTTLMWYTIIHLTFVVSAVMLASRSRVRRTVPLR